MPLTCDHWSLTIQIKRSYPRQHNFSLKCLKATECFACKVIRDNTCLQSVTLFEEEKKKAFNLGFRMKKKIK